MGSCVFANVYNSLQQSSAGVHRGTIGRDRPRGQFGHAAVCGPGRAEGSAGGQNCAQHSVARSRRAGHRDRGRYLPVPAGQRIAVHQLGGEEPRPDGAVPLPADAGRRWDDRESIGAGRHC
uniref:(northern house mosquito) hypothetical protein n=1 Tax=Culex pipiens TaxID=7175 RepID=A0A8D8D5M9_CULPI